jgi:crotonobetainyl-CoA:carnitine CoA-transferase CaiB-like acyl-CoA transferase
MLFTAEGRRVFPVTREEKEIDASMQGAAGADDGAGAPPSKEPAPAAVSAWSWPSALAGAAAGAFAAAAAAAALWMGLRRGRPTR